MTKCHSRGPKTEKTAVTLSHVTKSHCDILIISVMEELEAEGYNSSPEVVTEVPTTSRVTEFWVEFKKVTRSYAETDEVVVAKNFAPASAYMELMFHYLCAVTGLSSSSNTMSGNFYINILTLKLIVIT